MKKDILPDDILAAVLYLANFTGGRFRHNIPGWIDFFAEQRQKHEILTSIGIRDYGNCKASRELSQAYSNLASTSLIIWGGSDPTIHMTTPELREYFEIMKNELSPKELDELKKIAQEFRKKFSLEAAVG